MTELHPQFITESQIYSMISPYRSNKLKYEISDIFGTYFQFLDKTFGESRSIYFWLAFIGVLILGSAKAIAHTINYLKKKKFNPKEYYSLKGNMSKSTLLYNIEGREVHDSLEDSYQRNKKAKEDRAKNINALRMHLYMNEMILTGNILKVTNHRVSDLDFIESMRTGKIIKPFSTTEITFGSDINTLLKEVFPDYITLKKKKGTKETYITTESDDYGFLEEKLKNLYQEPIRVIFDY